MKVKVTHEFVAGVDTYPAGKSFDLPEDIAERVINAGWAQIETTEWPKHIGGKDYELSNGEKVKGKEAAIEAQKLINESGDDGNNDQDDADNGNKDDNTADSE